MLFYLQCVRWVSPNVVKIATADPGNNYVIIQRCQQHSLKTVISPYGTGASFGANGTCESSRGGYGGLTDTSKTG